MIARTSFARARVPHGEAPCQAGGDGELGSLDQKARLASTMVYAIEGKPARTAITPVVAPGYGGAALATTF